MRWHRKAEWSNGNVKSIVRNVFERNNCVYVTKFNDQNIKRSRHWRWKNYLCASSKFFSIKVLSFHSPRAYWPLFMACIRLNGLQPLEWLASRLLKKYFSHSVLYAVYSRLVSSTKVEISAENSNRMFFQFYLWFYMQLWKWQ